MTRLCAPRTDEHGNATILADPSLRLDGGGCSNAAARFGRHVYRLFTGVIWAAILALGIVGGVIGGIVGFGGSTILMPLLVLTFGPKDAVPIMGIAGMLANFARVVVWWREVRWRAAAVYAAAGIPGVILGARLFLALDPRLVEAVLGVFMIIMVPVRRWFMGRQTTVGLAGLAVGGGGIGFLTGLVASTGPISTPLFLAFGLVKGGFIATEGLASLAIYITKISVFGVAGALTREIVIRGMMLGATMMIGAWIAKRFVNAMDGAQYRVLIDALMVVAGVAMITAALW